MTGQRAALVAGVDGALVDPLSALLPEKASELRRAAIDAECAELLAHYAQVRDLNGKQAVV